MKKLTNNEVFFEFIYNGNKYLILNRLLAFYLSEYLLKNNDCNSIQEVNAKLFDQYKYYITNPINCKLDANKIIDFIIHNYIYYLKETLFK
jgi:hypothetical protein